MTIATNPLASPDVFSMTDEALAKMYQFSEETGVGNWGSVWLGSDKRTIESNEPKKVAIKVVHRTKTQTAAAQVRSLWNEMKVVRSLKDEPHPSVIVFESFIITPSYAIIVMPFLPKLLPVDIEEGEAKPWLAALSSAVCFLHARGVVHNDIKPANILLSSTCIPTLVDFGFSEKYELDSSDAFRTTLAYGTPEYLSPERAKGLTHDPRKSDIWSLGVTFFEILMGRTPFEKDGGEHFSTKEELDVYWSRTMKGKWVGAGSDKIKKRMSRALESLLRRMLEPNADVRIKSGELLNNLYWNESPGAQAGATCQESKSASSIPVRSILGNKLNTLLPIQPTKTGDNRHSRILKKKDGMTLRAKGSSNKENAPLTCTPEIVVTQVDGRRVRHKVKSQSVSNLRKNNLFPLTVTSISHVSEERSGSSSPTPTITPSSIGSSNNSPQVLQRTSARTRADRIFSNSPNGSTQAIGNAVPIEDVSATSLEPVAISARMVRHDRWMQEHNAREIRRIKSDLAVRNVKGPISRRHSEDQLGVDANLTKRGHGRTESYNSMYRRVPPIAVIPEAGSEDTDVIDLGKQSSCATAVQDIEKLYDEFLVGTNAVTRLGKGYQSNICTQNDPATFQKLSKKASQLLSVQGAPNIQDTANASNVHDVQTTQKVQTSASAQKAHGVSQVQHIQIAENPERGHNSQNAQKGHKGPNDKTDKKSRSEIKRQTSTNFFLSMRENHFARRKVRQAASFDGFARPRSSTTQPSATRPASAYLADSGNVMNTAATTFTSTLPTMATMPFIPATSAMNSTNMPPFTNCTNSKEKKRSTMTGAFRKAFFSLLGSEKISK